MNNNYYVWQTNQIYWCSIDSVSIGNVPIPSKSTSGPLGKVIGKYVRKYLILPIYTDPAGCLDMHNVCSNSAD